MGGSDGPKTDFGWEVWPKALYDVLIRITRDYDRPVLEVTENGCSYRDGPDASGVIHDPRRIAFYRGFLQAVADAIEQGADVRGYHAWTLLDNSEWSEGFEQRFGLRVDSRPRTARSRNPVAGTGAWPPRTASTPDGGS
jgi:beta-glucosidase